MALKSATATRAADSPHVMPVGGSTSISMPALPGRYQVGTLTQKLVDHTRPDPYAPVTQDRALMVQLWYPATQAQQFPATAYMPPATAAYEEQASGLPAGTLTAIGTHAHVRAPVLHRSGGWPVLVFSPRSGTSRTLYTTVVEDLATVVADEERDAWFQFRPARGAQPGTTGKVNG